MSYKTGKIYGPIPAVVNEVHDGDTVNVTMDLGFGLQMTLNCRVFKINAPELSTWAGKDARDFAREVLPVGYNVVIMSHGWDEYRGRFDGDIIYADGASFAETMLQNGHAVPYGKK